jgi:hypothetical protein
MQTLAVKCALCGRDTPPDRVEKHHLYPRSKRKKKEVPKGKAGETVELCCDCHGQIHRLFSTKEMVGWYHTVGRLKEDVDMIVFLDWIRGKKRFGIPRATKKRR